MSLRKKYVGELIKNITIPDLIAVRTSHYNQKIRHDQYGRFCKLVGNGVF